MMQVTASFNICGYQTRELNLTPAIGIALIISIVLLIGATTMS